MHPYCDKAKRGVLVIVPLICMVVLCVLLIVGETPYTDIKMFKSMSYQDSSTEGSFVKKSSVFHYDSSMMNSVSGTVEGSTTKTSNNEEIVILNRIDNSVNFYRTWAQYRHKFGKIDGNYWIGLESLHDITNRESWGIYVTMTSQTGEELWANHTNFSIGPESDNYRLNVSGCDKSSTAGCGLQVHNGMMFTTRDRDNDLKPKSNCSRYFKGGWWYKYCTGVNPTGPYDVKLFYSSARGYKSYYNFSKMRMVLIRKAQA